MGQQQKHKQEQAGTDADQQRFCGADSPQQDKDFSNVGGHSGIRAYQIQNRVGRFFLGHIGSAFTSRPGGRIRRYRRGCDADDFLNFLLNIFQHFALLDPAADGINMFLLDGNVQFFLDQVGIFLDQLDDLVLGNGGGDLAGDHIADDRGGLIGDELRNGGFLQQLRHSVLGDGQLAAELLLYHVKKGVDQKTLIRAAKAAKATQHAHAADSIAAGQFGNDPDRSGFGEQGLCDDGFQSILGGDYLQACDCDGHQCGGKQRNAQKHGQEGENNADTNGKLLFIHGRTLLFRIFIQYNKPLHRKCQFQPGKQAGTGRRQSPCGGYKK